MKKYILFKDEINGFNDVRETVKVVEKKAASHIHFLKNKVNSLREYKDNCGTILKKMSLYYWNKNHPLLSPNGNKKVLLVITGEKGIVGGLYHNLIEEVISIINKYDSVLVIGEKGKKYLRHEKIKAKELEWEFEDLPSVSELNNVSKYLFDLYLSEKLERLDLIYPQFFSIARQIPTVEQFLPFDLVETKITDQEINNPGIPIFEGGKKSIFDTILRSYINIFFTEIFMEAKLSEFSARTVSAENASIKTEQLITKINLQFLKARRKAITQNQLESFAVNNTI